MSSFNESLHRYSSSKFAVHLNAAVKFFLTTPCWKIPVRDIAEPGMPPSFAGPGVYALYYRGDCPIYAKLPQINEVECVHPIYIGSALPSGWRKARATVGNAKTLYNRLRQHAASIASTTGERKLEVDHFWCRFMIMRDPESKMITTVESQLVYIYRPLWNSYIDGFGNHDVGQFRAGGRMTQWDTLHSGRYRRGTTVGASPEELIEIIDRVQDSLAS